jgi:muconolactone delta-isomerase
MAGDASRVAILYTPVGLAVDMEAGDEFDRINRERAAEGRIGKELLSELRSSGWLRQARWRRGGYFTTVGLRQATDHPELVLLNVPGAFAPWAHHLLNEMAGHLVETGTRLQPGEIFAFNNPRFPGMAVTFDLLEPGDMQLPEFVRPVLIVVPLP